MNALLQDKLLKSIKDAAVYDVAIKTPLQFMENLSSRLSTQSPCEIYIKREDMQPVYSFKLRGAYNKLSLLSGAQPSARRKRPKSNSDQMSS